MQPRARKSGRSNSATQLRDMKYGRRRLFTMEWLLWVWPHTTIHPAYQDELRRETRPPARPSGAFPRSIRPAVLQGFVWVQACGHRRRSMRNTTWFTFLLAILVPPVVRERLMPPDIPIASWLLTRAPAS